MQFSNSSHTLAADRMPAGGMTQLVTLGAFPIPNNGDLNMQTVNPGVAVPRGARTEATSERE
ncbi:hypothetical protein E2C01_059332 [Portunus trituberculatus]|uniref:Uncharacterized protein n=1 Tax=Portunus trituberculatus TaxID=210409 RepID=A0A5B7GXV1_PORTR|nr:hypothetical protein [Portunus trituberculatus]